VPSPFRGRHWGRPTLLLTALAATLAFVFPAVASAEEILVNSTADEADMAPGTPCNTAAGKCTLRAAIQVANLSAGGDDVFFDLGVFNGQPGSSTITLGSVLPTITSQIHIFGMGCSTAAGVFGPCSTIKAPSNQPGLTVEGDNSVIDHLSISGGSYGIRVIGSTTGVTIEGCWIGLNIDGSSGGNSVAGIFIDPDSNGVTIGGNGNPERNVIANNTIGLDIEGADNADVRSNYFGVGPNGTASAPNIENLEVTGTIGNASTGTVIGADVGATDPELITSTACDGGCNVFGPTLGAKIDFNAESGQNEIPVDSGTVIGNYIGLNANGGTLPGSSLYGVFAVGAKNLNIGGGEPGEANHINGGGFGVYAEKAPNMLVGNNMFGLNVAGTEVLSPVGTSVYVFSDESLPPGTNALVTENTIASGESGIGVEIQGVGANVVENTIGLGTGGEQLGAGGIGVYAKGSTGGSAIEGNTIFGASQVGVLLKSPFNSVNANTIEVSAEAGVRVEASPVTLPVFGTEIGGDDAESENVISGTNGSAIELIEQPGGEVSETVIRRNRGVTNADVFIDLGGNGQGTAPGQPNEGIQAPSIDNVTSTSASGTAEAFARVRLFRKAGPSVGEIQSFLGASTADGSGNWTIGFPQQVAGTNIAATQTGISGTSELEFAVTPPDPPKEEPEVCAMAANGCGPGGPNPHPRVPDTKIAKKPKLKGAPTAKFKFTSTVAGSTFECKLDKKPFKKCRSPKTYKKLKPGKHVFKVRAVSPTGVKDSTPAKKKFKVKG